MNQRLIRRCDASPNTLRVRSPEDYSTPTFFVVSQYAYFRSFFLWNTVNRNRRQEMDHLVISASTRQNDVIIDSGVQLITLH